MSNQSSFSSRERGWFDQLLDGDDTQDDISNRHRPISLRSSKRNHLPQFPERDDSTKRHLVDASLEDRISSLIKQTQSSIESEQISSVRELRLISQDVPRDRAPIFVRHNAVDHLVRFLSPTTPLDTVADVLTIFINISYAATEFTQTIITSGVMGTIFQLALSDHQRASTNAWGCLFNFASDGTRFRDLLVQNDICSLIFQAIQKATSKIGNGECPFTPIFSLVPPLSLDTIACLRYLSQHKNIKIIPQHLPILTQLLYCHDSSLVLNVLEVFETFIDDSLVNSNDFHPQLLEMMQILYPSMKGDSPVPFCTLIWQLFCLSFDSFAEAHLTFYIHVNLVTRRRVDERRNGKVPDFLTKEERRDLSLASTSFSNNSKIAKSCLNVLGMISSAQHEFAELVLATNAMTQLGHLLLSIDELETEDVTPKVLFEFDRLRAGLATNTLPPKWEKPSWCTELALRAPDPTPVEMSYERAWVLSQSKSVKTTLSLNQEMTKVSSSLTQYVLLIISNLAAISDEISLILLHNLFPSEENTPLFTVNSLLQLYQRRSPQIKTDLTYVIKNMSSGNDATLELFVNNGLMAELVMCLRETKRTTNFSSTIVYLNFMSLILNKSTTFPSTLGDDNQALRDYYEQNGERLIAELAQSKNRQVKHSADKVFEAVDFAAKGHPVIEQRG
ncbi:hypothetical protein BLNAU_8615 [Blattamonas nauphoetae]|uniref:Uncharacterized protein n=1 Tax=Blattamonas nauphoetae TaxID=2049346 RepID=A0ABQ9XY49_9EUKA|nr:hypothetical protein BLNAU_8615 [Blattamonas nauphoetae]